MYFCLAEELTLAFLFSSNFPHLDAISPSQSFRLEEIKMAYLCSSSFVPTSHGIWQTAISYYGKLLMSLNSCRCLRFCGSKRKKIGKNIQDTSILYCSTRKTLIISDFPLQTGQLHVILDLYSTFHCGLKFLSFHVSIRDVICFICGSSYIFNQISVS